MSKEATNLISQEEEFSVPSGATTERSPLHAAEAHTLEVLERVRPSVVQICARKKGSSDPFRGIGSGFVYEQRADGTALIGTNRHVAEHPNYEYQVWVYGKVVKKVENKGELVDDEQWAPVESQKFNVRSISLSPGEDAAVMVIGASNLKPAALANSGHVKVSNSLYTFGYGLGIPQLQFTGGKVTSVPRTPDEGASDIEKLYLSSITTDADIQHGNSGGIATDVDGNVIGLTTWGLPDLDVVDKGDGKPDIVGGTVRSGILPINSVKTFFKNFELFGAMNEHHRVTILSPKEPEHVEERFNDAVEVFKAQFSSKYGAASPAEQHSHLQAILNNAGMLSCFANILAHHSSDMAKNRELMLSLRTVFGGKPVVIHAFDEIEQTLRDKPEQPELEG